jgi:putative ABC transport system ATP-binding protein
MIRCRGLTKAYLQGDDRVFALRGVDLDVYPGELTLLVGPSGCGKTTLLSVIAGILTPTDGTVVVLNTNVAALSGGAKTRFRRKHVGFVFQQYNLLPALTAAENVIVPLVIAGRPRQECLTRAVALLEGMGMGDHAHSLPAHLSGGQQQRVAIARAMIHEPSVLVCDEPTSALDAQTGHAMMELLREISAQQDRAVVVVTHDARIFDFGDRIANMDDGRIVQVSRSSEPITQATG